MSLAAIDPIANPEAWDHITIGGVASPPCEISEGKRKHEWDIKKGKGSDGASVTYVGMQPMTFSVTFFLWDNGTLGTGRNHFKEWDAFIPLLKYQATKKAVQAVDIYHPSFEGLGIKAVVTESISNVSHKGGGMYHVTVEFLEYYPPPPVSAVSTPTKSDAAAKTATTPAGMAPDPAVVALDKELGADIDDAKKLGKL